YGGGCTSGHGVCGRHGDLHGNRNGDGVRYAAPGRGLTMRVVINVLAGLIFGLGLLVSGMANPAKVQNFLDLAGTFDPSLICVMLGAVVVTFLGYRIAFRRLRPVLVGRFSLPTNKNIDGKVVFGAALFGVGWGLSGFCPGPAITSLLLLAKGTLIF